MKCIAQSTSDLKIQDHNLDCSVANCTYTVPSHFDGRNDGDWNRMDGIVAGGNFPRMDHSVDTHTISANDAAWTTSDRRSNRRSLGTSVAFASCRSVHLDRWMSLQNAKKKKEQNEN